MSITVGFVKLEGRVPKRKYFGFIHTVNMHLQYMVVACSALVSSLAICMF